MRSKTFAGGFVLAVLVGMTATGSGASATPGSTPPNNPTPSDIVLGTLDGPAKVEKSGIEFKVKADTNVRTFTLTYPVGSYSGWHSHPGIVIAVVQSGSVARQVGCSTETFSTGQVFTEAAPHFVSNPGAVPAVLKITQIYPSEIPATELRIDEPAPVCVP